MRIYHSNFINLIPSILNKQVLNATVSKQVEGGYLINLEGETVFANSDVILAEGSDISLLIDEVSPSSIFLKIINSNPNTEKLTNVMPKFFDLPYSTEMLPSILFLSESNLPITKERLAFLSGLIKELTKTSKNTETREMHKPQKLDVKTILTFLKEPLNQINNIKFNDSKIKSHCLKKFVKEYLAIKVLNTAYEKADFKDIFYYSVFIPFYDTIHFKIVTDKSTLEDKNSCSLSFIVQTKNLGLIQSDITLDHNLVFASLTFEDKNALNIAKTAIQTSKVNSLIKNLQLKTGKITKKDFFYKQLEEINILQGINIKI